LCFEWFKQNEKKTALSLGDSWHDS
jgi:hypothetical protein